MELRLVERGRTSELASGHGRCTHDDVASSALERGVHGVNARQR
jgi:hypothetical protein